MAIHEPKIFPFMKTESMALSTGEATFLAISKQDVIRMGGKYGTCTQDWPKELMLTENITNSNYSIGRCQKYCILNKLLATCGCIDSYDHAYTADQNLLKYSVNGRFEQCSATNKTIRNCSNIVYQSFADNKLDCRCGVPCETHDYIYKASRSEWPSRAYSSYLASQLTKEEVPRIKAYLKRLSNNTKLTYARLHDSIQKNFLRLEIFFETSTYQIVKETATYSHMDLLSEFGGSISLWLGWSIFALLEFLVFLLHCLEALIIKYRN